MTWIQTYTGKRWDIADPKPDAVCLDDLAWALAGIPRYNAHTSRFYSVAEHSVLLALHAVRADQLGLARVLLLHDASEAYLGDLASPVKRLCPGYQTIEERTSAAIYEAFGIDPTPHLAAVKELDGRILHDERAALLGPEPADWGVPGEPLGIEVQGWGPARARAEWLSGMRTLGLEVGHG